MECEKPFDTPKTISLPAKKSLGKDIPLMQIKLGILGTGNMAEALISGLTAKKVISARDIIGFDIDSQRLEKMRKKYRIQTTDSATRLVSQCNLLLLAVKPQQLSQLLADISGLLTSNHLVLSIAAGVDTRRLLKEIGKPVRLVRLMPNTPALVGLGATAFFVTKSCKNADRQLVNKLFSSVGLVVEVKKEDLLDSVTALSGSGPAFVYLFLKALIDGGTKLGLTSSTSRQLAIQTVLGATTLLDRSAETPEDLIIKVASKGGTTEAGLRTLGEKGFTDAVTECLKAAQKRAHELRKI